MTIIRCKICGYVLVQDKKSKFTKCDCGSCFVDRERLGFKNLKDIEVIFNERENKKANVRIQCL